MSKIYSHSRIACFEKCPRQFYFRYVLEVPSTQEGIEAFLGKRVHEVLERLYQFVGEGRRPPLDKVLQRFRTFWNQHYNASRIKIVREENSPALYREIGERCLTLFYRRHYPFDNGETLGLEKRLVFPIDTEKGYQLQGIIDRLARARDGVLEIHDYKTSARALSQKDADADRQLALYQLAIERSETNQRNFDPSRGVRLVWHFLQKDQIRISTRTPEQLDSLREETVSAIHEIEAAIATSGSDRLNTTPFPTQKTTLCNWCDYAKICHASEAFDAKLYDDTLQQIAERSAHKDSGAQNTDAAAQESTNAAPAAPCTKSATQKSARTYSAQSSLL